MQIELTKDQISTIKISLRYSLERIMDYPHPDYEAKEMSMEPIKNVMQVLPDLRKIKEDKPKKGN